MTNSIVHKPAKTAAQLHPLIADRWSPRIYDPAHGISKGELESLGEAFRWAPSSMNQQPWKLALLTRGGELFDAVASRGLTGFNQTWAPNASVLAVVMAAKTFDGKARDMAATYFDVGLAASQLVTQAESMGLKSHYMGGIVPEAIVETLNVNDYEVVCVIAIGKQGSTEEQDQAIIDRENLERDRNNPGDVYLIDRAL